MSILDPLESLKNSVLAIIVIALGVVLVLTGGFAAWEHFVTIPRLEAKKDAAEANERAAVANTHAAVTANESLTGAVNRCNASIETVRAAAQANTDALSPILRQLGLIGKGVNAQLAAFTPDAKKSDCDNAKAEVAKFKAQRAK